MSRPRGRPKKTAADQESDKEYNPGDDDSEEDNPVEPAPEGDRDGDRQTITTLMRLLHEQTQLSASREQEMKLEREAKKTKLAEMKSNAEAVRLEGGIYGYKNNIVCTISRGKFL